MAGDGIAVIKEPLVRRVELDLAHAIAFALCRKLLINASRSTYDEPHLENFHEAWGGRYTKPRFAEGKLAIFGKIAGICAVLTPNQEASVAAY